MNPRAAGDEMSILDIARKTIELSERATKGPWSPEVNVGMGDDSYLYSASGPEVRDNESQASNDADLIAHNRNNCEKLAKAVILMREALEFIGGSDVENNDYEKQRLMDQKRAHNTLATVDALGSEEK